jgi:hypothetical protein
MFGIEPFPPPTEWRGNHPNYKVGYVSDLEGTFDAGVCIEVIEHLWPETLRKLVADLAEKSSPKAVYFFNTAQPSYVKTRDMNYLDPFVRGHIISYSLKGLTQIFSEFGFTVHPLPGRDWAFLAEFGAPPVESADELMNRLWTPVASNEELLKSGEFGGFLYGAALEGARCYLEAARSEHFAQWAQTLNSPIRSA